ncbi:recombinase family protein [Spirulina sp.]|uniref:recombinase family protein n=1 Tax=Spirulina sp. TaxID=1157 RepID=UPI003F729F62
MKRIGYARVSTAKQDESAQIEALREAGCDRIFHERVSTRFDRPELEKCLDSLEAGDVLVITKLDRLGRTQHEVINRFHDLQLNGIHVKTLDGLIDTEALGKMAPLVVGLLTGLAEVERNLINERTRESIKYRRANGGNLGGRPKAYTPEQAEMAIRMRKDGASYRTIAKTLRLGNATIKRIIDNDAAA